MMICDPKSIALVLAALSGLGAAGRAAEPTVTYTATGTFAASPVSGQDTAGFAGQPFQITVPASEAAKPIRSSLTWAEYQLPVTFLVKSRGTPLKFTETAHLWLSVGVPGQTDFLAIVVHLDFATYPLTFIGKVKLPSGTITTPAIQAFAGPVTLAPHDSLLTYQCNGSTCVEYTSTTLTIAHGTLTATAQ